MKRLLTAALAVFFMCLFLGLTAFAVEPETSETDEIITEDETPDDNADGDIEYMEDLPPVPPGTGTVIERNADSDGKLFYTIMTPDEHVFYLVIDLHSRTDNVYFLNAVTVADLAPLAELPLPYQNEITPTLPPVEPVEPPVVELPETPETEQPSGNTGMILIIAAVVVIGGGAGWYFKVYRPKQHGASGGDEYDPTINDNDYNADWDDSNDDSDETAWDGEDE